ncbi:MAG: patatin-like phospholipase family protein [Acidimicrobiia bacterium]|nr:patatin-like phospholipase family protein [Acidimicrobiia bacterium]MDX2466384.1 patatin-like phospholipase family protein [Acidimicrobiia bacterium]
MESDTQTATTGQLVAASVPALLEAMGADINPELAERVLRLVEPEELEAGDVLFARGDDPDAVFFVVTGRLLVIVDSEGRDEVIRRLGRGELIGEVSLLEGTTRTATIRADRRSVLARLGRAHFEELVGSHPGFLMGVTKTLIGRLLRPRPAANSVSTVALAIASRGLDPRLFAAKLVRTLPDDGETTHVSRAAVEAELGLEETSTDTNVRFEQYLDAVEADHCFTVFEADRGATPWTNNVLQRSDRVLIVCDPEPEAEDERSLRGYVAAARAGYRAEVWLVVRWPQGTDRPHGSAKLAERYGADRIVHLRSESERDLGRLARLATGTGTGLVLGGGGARGFAHIGAYRALTELGITVDAVAGASIGGVMSAAVALDIEPDEMQQLAVDGFSKVLDYTLPLVSMVKGARIARAIDNVFAGVDIEDLPLPFLCVSTNLTTSQQMVHDRGSVTMAVRAGLAIPGVIPPVPCDGELLVDGGVLDNLPVGPLHASGLVDTVIAVDVAPRPGPRVKEDYGLSVSGAQALRSKLGRNKRRYPGISAVLLRSMIVGSMERRDRHLADGSTDLYLDPDLRGISLLAFDKVAEVSARGYEAVFPQIQEWQRSRLAAGRAKCS